MKYLIKITFFFFSTIIIAQNARDSLNYSQKKFTRNNLSTFINKEFNTSYLTATFNYGFSSKKFFFGLSEEFNSTIIRSNKNNIKDDHYLSALCEYDFFSFLKFGFNLKNEIYSDSRNIEINKVRRTYPEFYSKWLLNNKIIITPHFGFAENKQLGKNDKGIIYGGEFFIDNLHYENFSINSKMYFQNEEILPRKNQIRNLSLLLSNNFEESFTNNINIEFSEIKKDFYLESPTSKINNFEIPNRIQSRTEFNYHLLDNINWDSKDGNYGLNLQGKVAWRKIKRESKYNFYKSDYNFDTQINEIKINFDAGTYYRSEKIFSRAKISYSEREEKHLPINLPNMRQVEFETRKEMEARKNNNSRLISLYLNSSFILSKKNILTFNLFHRKLLYDTPSKETYDDRDEIFSTIKLGFIHQLNPYLRFYTYLEVSLNRLAYLRKERSANNNKRRLIKLTTGSNFKSQYFKTTNSAEVSANYTVYDFEDLHSSLKSFSFRRISISDSSTLKLYKNISISFWGNVKISEQGNLIWTDFKSKPFRFLSELTLQPMFLFPISNFSLGIGIRYFSLKTHKYNQNNDKEIVNKYINFGPVTEFLYRNERIKIVFNGWYSLIKTEIENKNEINFMLKMDWIL